MNCGMLYVSVDVHEKESPVAVLEEKGALLLEQKMPTRDAAIGHELPL